MFISQLRPVYLSSLISYNRALEQKTRLLKTLENKPSLADTLEVWNTELAHYGGVIIKYRAEYINKLTAIMGEVHRDITGGDEVSLISYICSIKTPLEAGVSELEGALAEELRRATKRELEQRTALIGPHRDDILFYVKQDKAKNFASRGQCRTVILSLRLAQLEVIMRERGEYPVLLLDDITSELDYSRRQYLFDKVKGMQAIITCTDAELMGRENEAKFFKIDNGVVSGG